MNVKEKVILITGATGGLGYGAAKLLAQNGAIVWLVSRNGEKCEALAAELSANGYAARGAQLDVCSEEDWIHAFNEILATDGRVDVLLNNAGINIRRPIEEMEKAEWMTMMEVNTASVFLGCKHVIPIMRKQGGGAIINMSSMCGLIGHRFTPECYTATKGAVTLLTRSIAARYAKDGIRCNSVHPCTVETPLVAKMMEDPERRKERYDEIPLGRLGAIEDVANAVLYLASDEAAFLNGVNLPVDGGVTCY